MPSVLNPRVLPPSRAMVFTALQRAAVGCGSSTQRQASPLKGRVTLRPLPPRSKNSAAVTAKPSKGAGSLS